MSDSKVEGFGMWEVGKLDPNTGTVTSIGEVWVGVNRHCSRCGAPYWTERSQPVEEAHPQEDCDLNLVKWIMES